MSIHELPSEWFLLPAFSLYDEGWGTRSRKWRLCIYFLKWEIHF